MSKRQTRAMNPIIRALNKIKLQSFNTESNNYKIK